MNEMAPEATPLADAAIAFLRRSLSALDAMEDVADFEYLCGGDPA